MLTIGAHLSFTGYLRSDDATVLSISLLLVIGSLMAGFSANALGYYKTSMIFNIIGGSLFLITIGHMTGFFDWHLENGAQYIALLAILLTSTVVANKGASNVTTSKNNKGDK